MKERNYHDQMNIDNDLKLRAMLAELPSYCKDFFRGIEHTTSSRTRIAYAYDLGVFFEFLKSTNPMLKDTAINQISLEALDLLKPVDFEEFMEHLNYYKNDHTERLNTENGKKRKLVALRTFFKYLYKNEKIDSNPTALISMPKLHDKEIVRLDIDEIVLLLDEVEAASNLTKTQQKFHAKTKIRDLAIMTLLLGTGIRVSECVGLDINDIDFKNDGIKIRRKGGYEVIVYFGTEVRDALLQYLEQRNRQIPESGHTNALFLSLQNKRINVRSVENLVKKYASVVTKLKRITPHKLRSTYGTNLYRETGDIYLVADVLGHKDVNTTKKHSAAIEDSRRRSAASAVKLRGE